MSQSLVSTIGFVTAVMVVLIDGRWAPALAAVIAVLGLTPTVLAAAGVALAGELIAIAALTVAASRIAWIAGRRLRWIARLDPDVPAQGPRDALFGPRSVRVAAAALAIPAASWVSFNVPIGLSANVQGHLFASAYLWLCGALRLVVARSIEDMAVGVVATTVAGGAGWAVGTGSRGGGSTLALMLVALAAASCAAWLGGRQSRREVGVSG